MEGVCQCTCESRGPVNVVDDGRYFGVPNRGSVPTCLDPRGELDSKKAFAAQNARFFESGAEFVLSRRSGRHV